MSGITTLLSERVESLLPHKATAAACTSQWCSSTETADGAWLYRYCRLCVHITCGLWMGGRC